MDSVLLSQDIGMITGQVLLALGAIVVTVISLFKLI